MEGKKVNKKLFLIILVSLIVFLSFSVVKVESACTTPADETETKATTPTTDSGPSLPDTTTPSQEDTPPAEPSTYYECSGNCYCDTFLGCNRGYKGTSTKCKGGLFNMFRGTYCCEGCEEENNQTEKECTDSDNGKYIYKKGTTTGYFETDRIRTEYDSCQRQQIEVGTGNFEQVSSCEGEYCYVSEHWSSTDGKMCAGVNLPCPNGCKDGACIHSNDIYCSGIGWDGVFVDYSEGWYQDNKLIKKEKCKDCEAICKSIGTKSEGWYSSCTGQLIKWDNCDSNNPVSCIKEGEKGSMFDDNPNNDVCCVGLGKVQDSYTTEEGVSYPMENPYYPTKGCLLIRGNFVCTNCGDGKCGLGENKCNCPEDCGGEIVCTDSDGGKDYYAKGIVDGKADEGYAEKSGVETRKFVDLCSGAADIPEFYGLLIEGYCDENGFVQEEEYYCPNGCEDGACIEEGTEKMKIKGRYIILNENFPDDVYSSPVAFYIGVLPVGKIVRTLINFDLSGLENKEIKKAELVINKIPMLQGEEYGKQTTEVHGEMVFLQCKLEQPPKL